MCIRDRHLSSTCNICECRRFRHPGKLHEHQPHPTPCGSCMYFQTTALAHFFRTRTRCTDRIRTIIEDEVLDAFWINPVNNTVLYVIYAVCSNFVSIRVCIRFRLCIVIMLFCFRCFIDMKVVACTLLAFGVGALKHERHGFNGRKALIQKESF